MSHVDRESSYKLALARVTVTIFPLGILSAAEILINRATPLL